MPDPSSPANPTPAAFISYSREDSEFALRLATDLKAAGASVWIDQLDIATGQLWDNAIEDALTAVPCMLLVLSPGSARSNNVRNEISFALEQGKTVLPILYQDCTVPLQLQRANRIDFRGDYAHGLATLLACLKVPHPATPRPPAPHEPVPLTSAPVSAPPPRTSWAAPSPAPSNLPPVAPQAQSPAPASPAPPSPVQQASVPPERPGMSAGRLLLFAVGLPLLLVIAAVGYFSLGRATPAPAVESVEHVKQPNAGSGEYSNAAPRKPGVSAEGYEACVFAPVSHVRVEPAGRSAIACSIDTVRTIRVGSDAIHRGNATWWPTDVCGTPGYIADDQIHVQTSCPAAN